MLIRAESAMAPTSGGKGSSKPSEKWTKAIVNAWPATAIQRVSASVRSRIRGSAVLANNSRSRPARPSSACRPRSEPSREPRVLIRRWEKATLQTSIVRA
jgi:hypothetical protein